MGKTAVAQTNFMVGVSPGHIFGRGIHQMNDKKVIGSDLNKIGRKHGGCPLWKRYPEFLQSCFLKSREEHEKRPFLGIVNLMLLD